MTNESIIKKLRALLERMNIKSDLHKLEVDQNLFSSGVLDSLTLIQFVLLIEEEFKIRIENANITYDHFKTLRLIADRLSSMHTGNSN